MTLTRARFDRVDGFIRDTVDTFFSFAGRFLFSVKKASLFFFFFYPRFAALHTRVPISFILYAPYTCSHIINTGARHVARVRVTSTSYANCIDPFRCAIEPTTEPSWWGETPSRRCRVHPPRDVRPGTTMARARRCSGRARVRHAVVVSKSVVRREGSTHDTLARVCARSWTRGQTVTNPSKGLFEKVYYRFLFQSIRT